MIRFKLRQLLCCIMGIARCSMLSKTDLAWQAIHMYLCSSS